jgi:hypothetical protein
MNPAAARLEGFLGWNVRAPGFRAPNLCSLSGSFIAFAPTTAERLAVGDPRKSLQERYGTHEGYVRAVKHAAPQLMRERFLIEEDADRFIQAAEASEALPPPLFGRRRLPRTPLRSDTRGGASSTAGAPLLVLEDRVDECGKRATLCEEDKPAKKQYQDHDRQQPPLLLLPQELEVLGDDPQLFHGVTSINSCLFGSDTKAAAQAAPSRFRAKTVRCLKH